MHGSKLSTIKVHQCSARRYEPSAEHEAPEPAWRFRTPL